MELLWPTLVVLGLAVMVAEAFVVSGGLLAGIGAFLFLSALAALSHQESVFGLTVTDGMLAAILCAGVLALGIALYFVFKTYSRQSTPLLVDETVTILSWINGAGEVRVKGGEIWQAVSTTSFQPGDHARVVAQQDLVLTLIKE